MNIRRRLELLEALATMQEAAARAMLIALEDDHPPNVERSADKTGPRSPFSGVRAIDHLKRVLSDARTASERERVRKVARKLAAQGLLTDGDVASLEKP